MRKCLHGQGLVFYEVTGNPMRYELAAGQSLLVDEDNLVGFSAGVTVITERIKGVKNVLFGGRGFSNTKVTGPGVVWM